MTLRLPIFLLCAVALLTGCNTISGIGRDISSFGSGLAHVAKK